MDNKPLVNADNIRSSIKRLFTGTVTEILGELLQNSQRAGASEVNITTDNKGFKYEDNGCGLKGAEGFYKMLSLGDSDFESPIMENQDPMGLGFGSLLAHEQIEVVRITSNGLSLEIHTKRWWDKKAYYSTWERRLKETKSSAKFRLEVKCDAKVNEAIKKALPTEIPAATYWVNKIKQFPGLGYEGILEIKLNGIQAGTGYLERGLETDRIISKEINGNKITIYPPNSYLWDKVQAVNWYGQLIKCELQGMPFRFIFEVRKGKPLNPKAPVRDGFIEDKKLESFAKELEDTIFQELCKEETNHATVENIKGLYKLNPERASNQCPYITAASYRAYQPGESEEEDKEKEEENIFLKRTPPLLIEGQIKVVGKENEKHRYGISSFIEQIESEIGEPHELTCKCTNTKVKQLIWKPGKKISNRARINWFHSRGEFCLAEGESRNQWHTVKNDVFAFPEPNNWDVEVIDWTIGCQEPIKAIEKVGIAGFDPYNDETETEELRKSYEDSIDSVIIRLSPPPPEDEISQEVREEIRGHLVRRLKLNARESIRNIVIKLNDEDENMIITGNKITATGNKESFYMIAKVYR
jgi:hypothetical protein